MRDYKKPFFTAKQFDVTADFFKFWSAPLVNKIIVLDFLLKLFEDGNEKFEPDTFIKRSGIQDLEDLKREVDLNGE